MATRDLEPDLSLPDLDIPGRPKPPGQPEFVRSPGEYLSEVLIHAARGAGQAPRRRAPRHAGAHRARIRRAGQRDPRHLGPRDRRIGTYKLPHNAIRVLATQAYLGRRKEQFREEFLLALKMLQEGHVKLADMKSSWAGAMGHTQFLPTDFYKYAVDFDGDGQRDIWNSVPDALASAAKQLVAKGWQPAAAGPTRCARRAMSTAPSPSRASCCRSANGSSAATRLPMAAVSRPRNSPSPRRC